ncbi:neuropeptide-like 2 [Drosophila suzukii]|uniref:Neuropeptide-like 2 n=1 Tax=Drosophila suzukii TaxID=28584 RepID=A0ABM4TQ73_DROSZ
MSSLADVQSVLKSSFSSSEFRSSNKIQLKMAKIALIFLLFALFAVAMSASVPSEEASNPVQDVANQIAKAFRENTTPEKIDELKEKFGEFWNAALESAKKISAETNQKIQEFENKAH